MDIDTAIRVLGELASYGSTEGTALRRAAKYLGPTMWWDEALIMAIDVAGLPYPEQTVRQLVGIEVASDGVSADGVRGLLARLEVDERSPVYPGLQRSLQHLRETMQLSDAVAMLADQFGLRQRLDAALARAANQPVDPEPDPGRRG